MKLVEQNKKKKNIMQDIFLLKKYQLKEKLKLE
jgi:hypothetical protein